MTMIANATPVITGIAATNFGKKNECMLDVMAVPSLEIIKKYIFYIKKITLNTMFQFENPYMMTTDRQTSDDDDDDASKLSWFLSHDLSCYSNYAKIENK